MDDSGNWHYHPANIASTISTFYTNLYTTDHTIGNRDTQLNPSSLASISYLDHDHLVAIPSMEEVKRVVFSFKPNKAPSPNGLHSFMYQKF